MFASSDDESSRNEHPLNTSSGAEDSGEFTDVLTNDDSGVHERSVPLRGPDSPTGSVADHRTVGCARRSYAVPL